MGAACSQYVTTDLRTEDNGELCVKCGHSYAAHQADYKPEEHYSEANERQIGGSHYKTGGEEHWDRVNRLGLDYFQGQITKYVERWKKKGGVQDLLKAQHFLQKYIELNTPKTGENADGHH
jgi:hypothetical protein